MKLCPTFNRPARLEMKSPDGKHKAVNCMLWSNGENKACYEAFHAFQEQHGQGNGRESYILMRAIQQFKREINAYYKDQANE